MLYFFSTHSASRPYEVPKYLNSTGVGGVDYPLLSDYNKEVSRLYEVLMDTEGIALRGTFIIDPNGVLKHISINDTSTGRSVNEVLRLLSALQTKKACPV